MAVQELALDAQPQVVVQEVEREGDAEPAVVAERVHGPPVDDLAAEGEVVVDLGHEVEHHPVPEPEPRPEREVDVERAVVDRASDLDAANAEVDRDRHLLDEIPVEVELRATRDLARRLVDRRLPAEEAPDAEVELPLAGLELRDLALDLADLLAELVVASLALRGLDLDGDHVLAGGPERHRRILLRLGDVAQELVPAADDLEQLVEREVRREARATRREAQLARIDELLDQGQKVRLAQLPVYPIRAVRAVLAVLPRITLGTLRSAIAGVALVTARPLRTRDDLGHLRHAEHELAEAERVVTVGALAGHILRLLLAADLLRDLELDLRRVTALVVQLGLLATPAAAPAAADLGLVAHLGRVEAVHGALGLEQIDHGVGVAAVALDHLLLLEAVGLLRFVEAVAVDPPEPDVVREPPLAAVELDGGRCGRRRGGLGFGRGAPQTEGRGRDGEQDCELSVLDGLHGLSCLHSLVVLDDLSSPDDDESSTKRDGNSNLLYVSKDQFFYFNSPFFCYRPDNAQAWDGLAASVFVANGCWSHPVTAWEEEEYSPIRPEWLQNPLCGRNLINVINE